MAIQQLLREHHLLIPGNYATENTYDIRSYLYAAEVHGQKFNVLFDRNLVSPLVQLAKWNALPMDNGASIIFRLSAACLAFCTLADILVEPAMALYEYASTTSHADAISDHRHFRIADNVDPRHYIDIALGRMNRLPEEHLLDLHGDLTIASQNIRETNLQKTLNLWKPQYLYVLKTVHLLRNGLNGRVAAEALLRWQTEDAFYNAPATLFCLTAMSHKPPRGGMIKDVHKTILKVQKGIRNATWDICLISQWGKCVRDGNSTSWALSSNDIALRAIAQTLFIGTEESAEIRLSEFLRHHWGKRDGSNIFDAYLAHSVAARIGSQARTQATQQAFSRIDKSIWELEHQLGIQLT